ncbi:hypothetical protein [uncultured Paenibacillus sp.]|uniref:hypothetical protein n=1 Tax=uncultured Paenibacillus sp. TaxID=227322 RepID=UPI0015AB16B4|nr:hypothetical protein [uncultured Paenibacillus sp.]
MKKLTQCVKTYGAWIGALTATIGLVKGIFIDIPIIWDVVHGMFSLSGTTILMLLFGLFN